MLPVALSPCPNDTFLFHAWLSGHVGKNIPATPTFADIQTLNEWAKQGAFPLIKVSLALFTTLKKDYQLLPVGAALGFNCGPKIIAKKPFHFEDLPSLRIAIPGRDTTAHHLFKRLVGNAKMVHFCFYHEIASLLEADDVDCGLIIHESRFTFKKQGFVEIVDLGELWHQRTSLPLPLGGLALRRDVTQKEEILNALKDSLSFAKAHPSTSLPFILKHSQEKEPLIVAQHIETYINQETESLSAVGECAIAALLNCDSLSDCLY